MRRFGFRTSSPKSSPTVCWGPAIIAIQRRPLPLWGKRADRTYLNAVETFAPFAALVLIIHVTGKANAATAFWSMFFFWARASHAAVYLLAIPYLRTLIFTAGFVAVGALFWELIR